MAASPQAHGSGRDLILLITGNAVSAFGNAVYLITVTLLLKELTDSAFMLGLFQFLALAPGFLLSPLTGVVVVRLSRRSIIIGTDLYRGALMLLAAAALAVPALRSGWFVLTIAFLSGIGHALFVPAVHALLPALVQPAGLQTATALRAAGSQVGNLGGSAAGGALFALPLSESPVDVALRATWGHARFDIRGGDLKAYAFNAGAVVSREVEFLTPYAFLGLNFVDTEVKARGVKYSDDETDLAVAFGALLRLGARFSVYGELAHVDELFFSFGARWTL